MCTVAHPVFLLFPFSFSLLSTYPGCVPSRPLGPFLFLFFFPSIPPFPSHPSLLPLSEVFPAFPPAIIPLPFFSPFFPLPRRIPTHVPGPISTGQTLLSGHALDHDPVTFYLHISATSAHNAHTLQQLDWKCPRPPAGSAVPLGLHNSDRRHTRTECPRRWQHRVSVPVRFA